MKRFNLTIIIIFSCQGCVFISNQKYPPDHKLLVNKTSSSCIDINGTYSNDNFPVEDKRVFFANNSKVSLAAYLVGGITSTEKADKVMISQDSRNILEVTALEGEKVVASAQYCLDKKDFKCGESKIIFKTGMIDTSGTIGILLESEHIELSKTEDLDLVLRMVENGGGVLVIPPLPLFGNSSYLSFFKKLK